MVVAYLIYHFFQFNLKSQDIIFIEDNQPHTYIIHIYYNTSGNSTKLLCKYFYLTFSDNKYVHQKNYPFFLLLCH